MSLPVVTVLIDTYNHQLFIEEAIQSVFHQTFPVSDCEILVVDDGSTDNTPEIVRKFAPRVTLLRKQNGGQASAFNAGIPQVRGQFVSFLDGDDWWAPGKLSAVMESFSANPDVGLVGHGVTEVHPDGRRRTEVPREVSRFRIGSPRDGRTFRMQRGFLGTSRMSYRKEILDRIGAVPEAIRFEADEYLFTLAGFFADVLILTESLTFYRVHGGNLFQLSGANEQAVRRKQQVLVSLTQALQEKLTQMAVPKPVARTILECVELEAEVLRLGFDRGFPWETLATELKIMRVFHTDASLQQQLFSYARMLPAAVLPSNTYYRLRRQLTELSFYKAFRRKLMPFPVPDHVERREKLVP